jgi:hypothetical protein
MQSVSLCARKPKTRAAGKREAKLKSRGLENDAKGHEFAVSHPSIHGAILDPPSRPPSSSEDKSQITPLDDRHPQRPRRLPLHRFMLEAYSRNRDTMTYMQ